MGAFEVSASGLAAQRTRINVIANNIANAQTTRTEDGGPYRRRNVIFEEIGSPPKTRFARLLGQAFEREPVGGGVKVSRVIEDFTDQAFMQVHDPAHPDAGPDGMVTMPNIRITDQMADLINATRTYEANVTALNATKQINAKTLEIGR